MFSRYFNTRSFRLKVVSLPEVDKGTFVASVECVLLNLFGDDKPELA